MSLIAHIDADSFFASVLVRKDPKLRGKPLLALGMGGGCVIAASYEAKAFGVKTGMRLKDALKLVPHALQIASDFRETGVASHEIESILENHCPIMEQYSIDEWFLDLQSIVGGDPDDPLQWARDVQKEILKKTALSVSIGIGPTKLLAKMAGEYRKPAGVGVVRRDAPACPLEVRRGGRSGAGRLCKNTNSFFTMDIETFLRDRPAEAIPGIGRQYTIKADKEGWTTAWDIATANDDHLRRLFGRSGIELKRELLGEVIFPVTNDHDPPKSVSRARSFRGTSDREYLWAHMLRHLEYTVLKMRRDKLACLGIGIWLRDSEYEGHGNNCRLPQLATTEEEICSFVAKLFENLYRKDMKYTQTGLILWGLTDPGSPQYSFFEDPEEYDRSEELQKALDEVHERYGRKSLTRAAALAVSSGTRPELPFMVLK